MPDTRIPFYVIDAFTDMPMEGNPAGVFIDDHAQLTPDEMRRMAGEVHLESAFVVPAGPGEDADYRLRYFTSVTEVPFCGHATIAATVALAHAGRIERGDSVRFVNGAGPLPVDTTIDADGGLSVTLIQRPREKGIPLNAADADVLGGALGCGVESIEATGLPAQVYSNGTAWLYAPVNSRECVDKAPADMAAIARLSKRHQAFGVYVFSLKRDDDGKAVSVWSRCFAPGAGLHEDPVTGSASGGLGWYLTEKGLLTPGVSLIARQGIAGGRGGTAIIRSEGGGLGGPPDRVYVTGTATPVAEGVFLRRSTL